MLLLKTVLGKSDCTGLEGGLVKRGRWVGNGRPPALLGLGLPPAPRCARTISTRPCGNVSYGGIRNPPHNRKGAGRKLSAYGCARRFSTRLSVARFFKCARILLITLGVCRT